MARILPRATRLSRLPPSARLLQTAESLRDAANQLQGGQDTVNGASRKEFLGAEHSGQVPTLLAVAEDIKRETTVAQQSPAEISGKDDATDLLQSPRLLRQCADLLRTTKVKVDAALNWLFFARCVQTHC